MSSFHADNIATVRLALRKFAAEDAKKAVLKRMWLIAGRMVDYIDGHFNDNSDQFPEWSGNLHDATGVGIYDDGRLECFIPTKRAGGTQMGISGEEEWGGEELSFALKQGCVRFPSGLWLVLFSASSYAEKVEDIGSPKDRGQNFFTTLWEQLRIDVKNTFRTEIMNYTGLP